MNRKDLEVAEGRPYQGKTEAVTMLTVDARMV